MATKDKLRYCEGCGDDFYNDHNPLGVKECWSLKTAKVVRRFKLGWWTQPDSPGAFIEVTTLNCHHERGKYAFYKVLPDFVRLEDVRSEASNE